LTFRFSLFGGNWGKKMYLALRAQMFKENFLNRSFLKNSYLLAEFKDDLETFGKEEENLSKHSLRLTSGEVTNPGIQFSFDLILGSDMSKAVLNYLNSYKLNVLQGHWLAIDFHFDKSFDANEFKKTIDEKVNFIIENVDKFIPGFKEILKNFVNIETRTKEGSVNITLRLKVDAENFFKTRHRHILAGFESIFHAISNECHFSIKTQANFKDLYQGNLTGFDILKNSIAEIRVKMMREHLRLIAQKLTYDLKQFVYVLTAPQNVDLNINWDPKRAAGPRTRPILETPLGFIQDLVKLFPLNSFVSDPNVIKKVNGIEFNFNGLLFFANLKLCFEGLFG